MERHAAIPKMRITMKGLEMQIKESWCLASYLILNFDIKDYVTLGERELPKEFAGQMAKYIYSYMYYGEMPPAEIEQTVLNAAEDFSAGRPVQLRAGDYIAAQRFFGK